MSKYRKRSRKFSYKNIVKRRRTQGNSDDGNRLYATYPFIFQSFNVYILSVNLGAARRYVLANLVCKYGGRVSYCVTDNTSHVLVDENVTSAAVCQALEWTTYPPHINVVLASWVSACIRANYCLDASDYELPCTHKPTFVSHHNRLILWRNQQKRSESDFRETDRGSGVSNEMTRANVDGEVSPFDDGLYEVETSCDDSWLYEIAPHPILFDYLAPQCIKKARSGSEQINSAASKQCNPVYKGSPLRGFKRRRRDSRIIIQNKSVVVAPAAKSNACPDGGTVSENKESINKRAISISSATASLQSVNDEKAKISASSVEYTELKQSFPEGERNSPSCSPLNLSKSFNSGDLIGMIKNNTTEVSDTAAAQSSMEISTTTADRSLKAENLSVEHSQSYQLKHTFKNEMAEDLTSREIPLIWKKEYLKCEKLELDHKNSEHTQTSSSDVKASSIGYANTFVNVSVTVTSSKICNSVSVEHSELEPANHEIKNEELTAVEYKKQVSLASELTPQNLSLSKRKQNLIHEKSVSEKSFALETFKISNFKLDDKVSSRKNYCKTSVPNLDEIESVSGIKPLSSVVTCFTEQRSLNIPKVDTKCQSFSFPSTSSNSLWSSGPSTSKSFFVDGPSTSNNSLCVAGPSTSTDTLYVAGPSTSTDTLYVAGPSTSTDTLYVAGPSTSSDDSLCAAGSSTSNNSFCVAGPSSSISNSLCIASPSFSFSNSLCIVGPSKKKLFFDKVKPKSTYIYSEHPNSLAIKTLQLLYDIFKKRKDNMRIHAYEKAIIALRKRKQAITSLEVCFLNALLMN
ncbi:uncharacterized protein LOC118200300 [Stegodyphus dumicola]|uniref:uncharacterized protein LOC118200300 n=1 Tax=Stegodyphus dumicola TaxID=202533 RepID=UPI0015B24D5D|nr:uncharacterized protein LOC118200300 [Stegodyphus dumicola]